MSDVIETADLTPAGPQTVEQQGRIEEACERQRAAAFRKADLLSDLVDEGLLDHLNGVGGFLKGWTVEDRVDLANRIASAIKQRRRADEAFLRAMAGRIT